VLALMGQAFDAHLLFTIGRSMTTGQDNAIVWNDIQQKTSTYVTPNYFHINCKIQSLTQILYVYSLIKSIHWLSYPQCVTLSSCVSFIPGTGPRVSLPVTQSQLSLAGNLCAHQPMASYLYLRSKPSSMETAISGPTEWNRLPSTLHDCSIFLSTFKKRLKTHLFQC